LFADARKVDTDATLKADLCIVGAGAAGIALAREFIGGSARVLLLESGGLEFDSETQSLYDGRLGGLPYFPLETARLRYFGGTTNHWGGLCRPFDRQDFERRDWVPHSGWPIGKDDLEPYYGRASDVVQLSSPVWQTGEPDPWPPLALRPSVVTRRAQYVPHEIKSFGLAYRDDIDRARNVVAYLHANVIEVVTDNNGTTATSVRVATLSGKRFTVEAKHFVLALGGLENPRLLLASNRTQPEGLGNRYGLVGRFFLEHPRFRGGVIVPADPQLQVRLYEPHRIGPSLVLGYLALSKEVQRREGLVDVQIRLEPTYAAAFAEALGSQDLASARALVRLRRGQTVERGEGIGGFGEHVRNVVQDLMSWQSYTVPGSPLPVPYPDVVSEIMKSTPSELQSLIPQLLGDIAGAAYRRFSGRIPLEGLNLSTRFEPAPNRDSRVFLISERDQLGMPKIQLDWRLSDSDKHSVRRTLEILGANVGRVGLGRLKVLFEEEASWPDDLAGGWHLMGTTRMSASPRGGVVNGDCRVHGMSNLYIAGSSVFPTAGSGTPTLTLVALALRLASHLRKALP
jgi:choline dehydrogenase-like flavoprotein